MLKRKGKKIRGRPPVAEKMVVLSVRVPPKMKEDLARVCAEHGFAVVDIIERGISDISRCYSYSERDE